MSFCQPYNCKENLRNGRCPLIKDLCQLQAEGSRLMLFVWSYGIRNVHLFQICSVDGPCAVGLIDCIFYRNWKIPVLWLCMYFAKVGRGKPLWPVMSWLFVGVAEIGHGKNLCLWWIDCVCSCCRNWLWKNPVPCNDHVCWYCRN